MANRGPRIRLPHDRLPRLAERWRRLIACLVLAACWLAAPPRTESAEPRRPDIVVLITDDQGQRDSQPYGADWLRTPQMQQLADDGLTFDRAFVASPSCAPSRAALLTGIWPPRNGAEPNHSKPRPELRKWPAYFQELGYEVVAFGKVAHYRHTADYGFDQFAHDAFHDHAAIPAAVKFLAERPRDAARPLCLMVGSNWPHVPWPESDLGYAPESVALPAGSIDTPETRLFRARYAAAVTKADDDLGTIRAAVREHLPEPPLFLFTSDHGAQWPFGKWNCYDAGAAVPLIVSWPGRIAAGRRTDALVSWIDLLPTLLEAAGGSAPEHLDGRSFLPVLRGERTTHRERIFITHSGDGRWNIYPIRSLRTADWKYIRNLHPEFAFTTHIDLPGNLGQRGFFATWEARARLDPAAAALVTRYHARPAEELYDLRVDPGEQRNLAAEPAHQERLGDLRAELDAWLAALDDRQQVFETPRLLNAPDSYGPNALGGNAAPRRQPAPQGPRP